LVAGQLAKGIREPSVWCVPVATRTTPPPKLNEAGASPLESLRFGARTRIIVVRPLLSCRRVDGWEQAFFQSEFTHVAGARKHTHFPGGLLAMWKSLEGKKKFAARYLVEREQTLGEFVTNHDHSYRNEHQPD
jgi:hypothetical protein